MTTQAIQRTLQSGGANFAGLPFAAVALLPFAWMGQAAILAGLFVAVMATFTAFMPLVAVLAGSPALALDAMADVPLTPRRYATLLALWSIADLGGAWLGS